MITTDPSVFAEQYHPSALSTPPDKSPYGNTGKSASKILGHQHAPLRWPRLMRKAEVAEYLSVSERYVDFLTDQGYIPGPRLKPSSRCVLWDRNDIDRLLDHSTAHPTNPRGELSFDDIVNSAEVR